MVQNAIVKKIVREGVAEVSLLRQMECGLHCDGACAGCTAKPPQEILALASNSIGARPGDFVEVEPSGGHNYSTSVVVFLLPCVGLGLGYALGMNLLRLSELTAMVTAVLGLAVGFIPAVLMNRAIARSAAPEFAILKLLLSNPQQVVTKSQLLAHIAADTPDCVESSLKVHVSNLRRKLRDAGAGECIASVWGIGFKLAEEEPKS